MKDKLDFTSTDGIQATSVPPNTLTLPNLTGALITDHVFAGVTYGPFTPCGYCQGHHAKHLYQSSAYVYHSAPYEPTPWWQPNPLYPIINYAVSADGNSNGQSPNFTVNVGSSVPTRPTT